MLLLQGKVPARGLSKLVRRRRHVEDVVCDLESLPDGGAILRARASSRGLRSFVAAQAAQGYRRRRSARPFSPGGSRSQVLHRQGPTLPFEVEQLSADHASGTRRALQISAMISPVVWNSSRPERTAPTRHGASRGQGYHRESGGRRDGHATNTRCTVGRPRRTSSSSMHGRSSCTSE